MNKDIFNNIQTSCITGGLNECSYDWAEYDCKYEYYKFYYYLSGESTLIIEDDIYHPKPGQLFIIPANTTHTFFHNPQKPVYQYWLHFELFLGQNIMLKHSKASACYDIEESIISDHFNRILTHLNSNSRFSSLSINIAILELLNVYLNLADESLVFSNEALNVLNIRQYILDNLSKDISLSELAAIVPLQPNYFISYFKKHFDTTPIRYINNMRLIRAATYLKESEDLSISSIAHKVGFRDNRYFSRVFKKKYGLSPREYKRDGNSKKEKPNYSAV